MLIRKAKTIDIPKIAEFQMAMALETEMLKLKHDEVNNGVKHIFQNPDTGFYLICENDSEIVGSLLVLYEWSDWRNKNVIWIHSVYILPHWRKKGIFGQMYQHIKSIVDKGSYIGIRLYVEKSNKNAQRVYEKLEMNSDHYVLYEYLKT